MTYIRIIFIFIHSNVCCIHIAYRWIDIYIYSIYINVYDGACVLNILWRIILCLFARAIIYIKKKQRENTRPSHHIILICLRDARYALEYCLHMSHYIPVRSVIFNMYSSSTTHTPHISLVFMMMMMMNKILLPIVTTEQFRVFHFQQIILIYF